MNNTKEKIENTNIKVSIIMPVYNSAKFLDTVMFFLTGQTLKEIEIIAVDDCSQDNSIEILKSYQQKFPDKIIVIESEVNGGPGVARNKGLEVARGEYIGFVDSDDALNQEMFELLYKKAKESDYDIVDCIYYDEVKKNLEITTPENLRGKLNNEKRGKLLLSVGYLWSKIFKKEFLDKNDLRLPPLNVYEDVIFLCACYLSANKIGAVDEALYIYRENPNSISKYKEGKSDEPISYFEKYIDYFYKYFKQFDKYKEFKEFLDTRILVIAVSILVYLFYKEDIQVNDLINYDNILRKYIPRYEKNKYIHNNNNKDFTKLLMINAGNPKKAFEIIKFNRKNKK